MTTRLKGLYIAAGVLLMVLFVVVFTIPQETLNAYEIPFTITVPPLFVWLYLQAAKEENKSRPE